MTHLDEATLIAHAQAGDRSALDRLLRRHRAAIERMCRRMCRDELDVDDVLQETYLAIMRSLPAFRADASFLTWVYTILRTHRGRSARTARRELGRRELLRHIGELSPSITAVDQTVESRQLLTAFDTAMSEIGPLDRDVAFLRDVEGLTAAEVSTELGLSVAAVKSRLHRARAALRSHMQTLVAA